MSMETRGICQAKPRCDRPTVAGSFYCLEHITQALREEDEIRNHQRDPWGSWFGGHLQGFVSGDDS